MIYLISRVFLPGLFKCFVFIGSFELKIFLACICSNILLTLIEIVLLKRMYNMKISSIGYFYLLPTSYSKNMMEPLANNSHVRSLFELLSVQWILNVCMFKWNGLAAIIYLSSFIIVRDDDKTMKNYAIHSGPGLKK